MAALFCNIVITILSNMFIYKKEIERVFNFQYNADKAYKSNMWNKFCSLIFIFIIIRYMTSVQVQFGVKRQFNSLEVPPIEFCM